MKNGKCKISRRRPRAVLLHSAFFILHSSFCISSAAPPWPDTLIRLERLPASGGAAHVSTALAVAPGLLASIIERSVVSDSYRAVAQSGTVPLKLLARDEDSGFSLLAPVDQADPPWPVVPLENVAGALPPGTSLTLQSAAPAPVRLAGRDVLHGAALLQTPWLRVHLPAGTWVHGTPLTAPDNTLAGLLAGGVPQVPEAARMLPAAAVRHFVRLWTDRQTLARAELGIRLNQTDAIPRVIECYAALPAERAGMHPGDVLLRINGTDIADAAAAAEVCFYLRVDESAKAAVLRGTDVIEFSVPSVSVSAKNADVQKQ